MQIGTGPGPDDAPQYQSSHYVYDVRSGVIVGVYHFAGAAPKSEPERVAAMLESSHEASGIPLKQLSVLSCLDVPAGEGQLHIEHAKRRLVRKRSSYDPRVRA